MCNIYSSPADLAVEYLLNSSQSDLGCQSNLTIFLPHLKPFRVPPISKLRHQARTLGAGVLDSNPSSATASLGTGATRYSLWASGFSVCRMGMCLPHRAVVRPNISSFCFGKWPKTALGTQ
ncbi:unnamed protein product [Rangifer tarandus platyrhynchus]|uniref:Uncharacterized protein n=2 Tax=Rangifer tarandus platyrhynchus TaxID=3082113 RepID=A0ABN8YCD2_RANTA|nr:unnamed protein product [Rangifer tarandus platyrhynchus]